MEALNLRGSDSKYTLLGDLELINGHVVINNNDFDLTRALVVFGDRNTYLPDLNPNIFIESVVNLKKMYGYQWKTRQFKIYYAI